jgi:WD40 repeat protein
MNNAVLTCAGVFLLQFFVCCDGPHEQPNDVKPFLTVQHPGIVRSVAFSPDNQRLLTCSDRSVRVWGCDSGRQLFECEAKGKGPCQALYHPDGKEIAVIYLDGTISICSAGDGKSQRSWSAGTLLWHFTFDPSGKRLATTGCDRLGRAELRIWDISTAREVLCCRSRNSDTSVPLQFDSVGKRLAWCGDALEVVDSPTGKTLVKCENSDELIFPRLAWSPDERWLVASSGPSMPKDDEVRWWRIHFWDATNGKHQAVLEGHDATIQALAMSPDNKLLASVTGVMYRAGECKLWDIEKKKAICSLNLHPTFIWSVCFSPDGKRLATAGHDGTAKVWDVAALLGIRK